MSVSPKEQEQALLILRDKIDLIDQKMHELLNQRAVCAQEVAQVKEKFQGVDDAVFYRPEREAQVLRKVMQRNKGPLEDKAVARLFREIMSVCLAHEKPLQVAYLGPAGAFAQLACNKHFGSSALPSAMNSLEQVFKKVDSGEMNYGVVPIVNSTQGVATYTLDLFKRYALNICGEVELSIQLHLYAQNSTPFPLSKISKIYGLSETFAQSSQWIDTHCAQAKRIVLDNLDDAECSAIQEEHSVVIAGDGAMDNRWRIVGQNIGSNSDHKARFLIIGRQQITPSGFDKTSVLIATKDKPGALYELLTPFREHEVSLKHIDTYTAESVLGSDCSVFYIEFEGHYSDAKIATTLVQLENNCVEIKMLGSYPRAVL